MGFQQPWKKSSDSGKRIRKTAPTGMHDPTLDDFIYQLFAHFPSWLMWLEVAKDVTLSVKFVLVGEVSDCQFLRSARSLLILLTMTLGWMSDIKLWFASRIIWPTKKQTSKQTNKQTNKKHLCSIHKFGNFSTTNYLNISSSMEAFITLKVCVCVCVPLCKTGLRTMPVHLVLLCRKIGQRGLELIISSLPIEFHSPKPNMTCWKVTSLHIEDTSSNGCVSIINVSFSGEFPFTFQRHHNT